MSGSIQSTSNRSGRLSASWMRALWLSSASRTSKPARSQGKGDHLPDGPLILDYQYLAHGVPVCTLLVRTPQIS